MFLFLAFFSLLSTQSNSKTITDLLAAEEEKCQEVLLAGHGGSFEFVTPIPQDMGVCSFHAATAMFDAWRFSHGENVHGGISSPFALSLTTFKQEKRTSITGGSIMNHLVSLGTYGACKATLTENGHELLESFSSDVITAIIEANQKLDNCTYKDSIEAANAVSAVLAKSMSVLRPTDGLDFMGAENYSKLLYKIIKVDCGDESYIPPPKDHFSVHVYTIEKAIAPPVPLGMKLPAIKTRVHFYQRKSRMMLRLHEKLNQGIKTMPIGLSYFSCGLEKGVFNECVKNKEGSHASVIIGRRKNPETKSCEFLIQNTWSTDCENLKKQKIYHSSMVCEPGRDAVWVSSVGLANMANGIMVIK